jgi:hypothetical protein
MQALNLPSFDIKVRKVQQKLQVYDLVRKKYVLLTPEEWVRQHFINFLIQQAYPLGFLSVERGHEYNSLAKRTDIVVYRKNLQPFLLIECKAPHIKIDEKVCEQAFTYNLTINSPYLALSNGVTHSYFERSTVGYQQLPILPIYQTA